MSVRQQTLEPARIPGSLHPVTYADSPLLQVPIEFFSFTIAEIQSPFSTLTGLFHKKSNLLKARMIIYTYVAARFQRLAAKRGSKRAIVAIGHKILVLAHYMLQHYTPFRELGAEYSNGFVHRSFLNHLSVDYNASASKSR